MRILLVTTDRRVSVSVTTALLGLPDLDVLEVRTPQRALQQLDDVGGFALVVADADTAPTGGFAMSREVKARLRMDRDVPPVLLLIARKDDKWLAEWSEADAFIRKPVDPFDFREVVEALIEGRDVPALPRVAAGGGPLRAEAKRVEAEAAGAAGGSSGVNTAGP